MTSRDEQGSSRRDEQESHGRTENQRSDLFSSSEPISLDVSTLSGDIVVRTSEGNAVEVILRARNRQHDHLLDLAEVRFDAERHQLTVKTRSTDQFDSFASLKDLVKKRSWFDFGSSDLDVEVLVPRASAIDLTTTSGDVQLPGSWGDLKVSSVSGDVVHQGSATSLDVRTASGDVRAEAIDERLRVKTASGDVRCTRVGKQTEVSSASGDVNLAADQPGELVVKSSSGDVTVHVARGLAVDVNGNTVSGDLGSNINLDAAGDATSDDEIIFVRVSTVSGDVRINKAS